jgi:hypothetical protein
MISIDSASTMQRRNPRLAQESVENSVRILHLWLNRDVLVVIYAHLLDAPHHDGKYFISLDHVTANFNALKFYDPSIVLHCANWQELISKFTELEYFKRSKYFRQIVFGHLNPKKQAIISKFITSEVYRALSSKLGMWYIPG